MWSLLKFMFKPKLCIFSIHNSAPKIDRSMQFMSDFSFRHLVYHVSPDWWCCCPFTSRSSRRIDFTEKETLYSKTSWDPVEISLLQVRETYKKFPKPVRDPGKVLHYYMTLYLRASKISSIFFSSSLFFYTTMVWFVVSVGLDMNGKRRGEVSFCFFAFQFWLPVFSIFIRFCKLWQFLQFKRKTFKSILFQINVYVIFRRELKLLALLHL